MFLLQFVSTMKSRGCVLKRRGCCRSRGCVLKRRGSCKSRGVLRRGCCE